MSSQTEIILNGLAPEPVATGPQSGIDPTVPVYGNPTTQSVRDNFATAQTEITALMQLTQGGPFLSLAGGHMTGPMYLWNDPTDVMMPVTLGYFNAHGGGGTGGGGIPEAPADGKNYGRNSGAWVPVLPLVGGTANAMTGELVLAGNPTNALGAAPKQYVDAIATTANGAVQRAGDTMTGLLVLSADPTAALGAVTKQYADAGLALKAPINNPTFTGLVTTASRIIVAGASGPSITLNDTTASRPVFGIWNNNSLFSVGLTSPTTGNPNGAPFATMDQTGAWLFNGRVNATTGRLITSANAYAPSLTLNYTTQSYIYGLWNSGVLNFGISDASGAPQNSLATMDYNGSFVTKGNLGCLGNVSSGTGWFLGNGWVLNGSSGTINLDNGSGGNVSTLNLRANTTNFYGDGVASNNLFANNEVIATNGGVMGSWGVNYNAIDGHWIAWQYDGNANHLSLYVNGSYYFSIPPSSSDPRLKSDVAAPTVDALATIEEVTLHQFDMRWPWEDAQTVHHDLGFMSDQLRELIPASVNPGDDEKFDTVLPLPLIAYAFGAIQQLAARLAALEGKR